MKLRGLGVAYVGALHGGMDQIDSQGLEAVIDWKEPILTDGAIDNNAGLF